MVNDMDGRDESPIIKELKKAMEDDDKRRRRDTREVVRCRKALERIAEALEYILREVDTESEVDIKEKLRG